MIEMAPKSSKQKKKYKCCLCLSSPSSQEDVPGEQPTDFEAREEETRLLCLFENYLDYVETPAQNQEKVKLKAKKHRKKWKTWNVEKKKLSLTMGKENLALATNNSVPKTDKCLVKSKNDAEEQSGLNGDKRGFCKKLDSSFLKFLTEKKGKKLKNPENCDFMHDNEEVIKEAKHKQCYKAIPKNHSNEKQLCLPRSSQPYVHQKDKQKGLSWRVASGLQVPCKSQALDSAVCCFRGNIMKGFKQNRKLHKEAQYGVSTTEVNSCASITEPLLSSSPMTLEIKTCDSEEEFSIGGLKDSRPIFHHGSGAEEISSSFDSRELFITQKSFLPLQTPSSYLPLNPAASTKEAVLEISYDESNSPNTLQPSSIEKETLQVTPSGLISRKRGEQFLATRECAVQTDAFLGSLAVASSLIIKKDFTECREQPVDLSLPCRIRSCVTNAESVSHFIGAANSDIHACPKNKLENVKTVLYGEPRNVRCSPSQQSDCVKYIQTQLNSSYFFKQKGDPDATMSGSPLVKPVLGNKEKNNQ